MNLNDLEIIGSFPALFVKSIDAIIISDLHLGYEGISTEQGVLIPKIQYKEEIEMMKKIIKLKKAEKIILLGDIKHEFSETTYHEFKEVRDFLNFLKENFEKIFIIKGNHDNFIFYVANKLGIDVYDDVKIGDYFFSHGHRNIELNNIKAKNIVIAHEHPVIVLYDDIGGKEVVKCFLFGKIGNKNLIVMPAFSPLSYGSEININEDFLSPLLQRIKDKISDFLAIGIDEEVGILKFGRIKNLKIKR